MANKEVTALIRKLKAQGWTVTLRKGGHYRAQKGAEVVFFAATPSDHRAMLNLLATLRRKGFQP